MRKCPEKAEIWAFLRYANKILRYERVNWLIEGYSIRKKVNFAKMKKSEKEKSKYYETKCKKPSARRSEAVSGADARTHHGSGSSAG